MIRNYRVEMNKTMGSLDLGETCDVCCGRIKDLKVSHVHLSTSYYNRKMAASKVDTPKCYFCDLDHPIDHMTRNKLVLTGEHLSDVQYLEGWNWDNSPPVHIDIESIENGSITQLRRAWERACHWNPLPVDTVLVPGLQDLRNLISQYASKHPSESLTDLITTEIMASIKMLHNTVRRHSELWKTDDTLAVAPIMHVPALYWHKDDGNLPFEEYRNYAEVIDKINLSIDAYNEEFGVSAAPSFIKRAGERGLKSGRRIYRWDAWKESEKNNMINLNDKQKIAVMKKLVTYFVKATPHSIKIIPDDEHSANHS